MAIDLIFLFKGSILFSFFNNTIDSLAAFRARSLCFSQSFTSKGIRAYGTISGGSNMPSLNRALKRRLIDLSMISSVSKSFSTAPFIQSHTILLILLVPITMQQKRSQPALSAIATASSGKSTTL